MGSIKNKKILILGTSFKADCDDKRGSLAFKVRDELLKQYDFIKIVGPEDRSNLIGVISCLFDGYSADDRSVGSYRT